MRKGFFTDTSVCIGCKACEVACKEWNHVPPSNQGFTGDSYDNTVDLGADTWRHVAFIEQRKPLDPGESLVASAIRQQAAAEWGLQTYQDGDGMRWLMASDVCKHCTDAACLEVCPTGALFRTEFGTVVVQEDICNGCGYCVPACPFGVLDRREEDGRVWKCTLCYDRLKDDMEPACAKACPTDSIQFGELDDLRERAERAARGPAPAPAPSRRDCTATIPTTASAASARSSCCSTSRRSTACRQTPRRPTRDLGETWAATGAAALALGVGLVAAVFGAGEAGARLRRASRPVIKPPVWTWEIPAVLLRRRPGRDVGGLSRLAEASGNPGSRGGRRRSPRRARSPARCC